MTAATRVANSSSGWGTTGSATRSTGSVTWLTGDLMLVVGYSENVGTTLSTPTGLTGVTLAAVTGFPTTDPSAAPIYAWSAVASSGSSGAVSTTLASSTNAAGIDVFIFRNSGGLGAVPTPLTTGTSLVISTTRTGSNSLVVGVVVDSNATNDVTVATLPAGATQDDAATVTGRATAFCLDWGDQGGAGTTSYGLDSATFTSTGPMVRAAFEILGLGSSLINPRHPSMVPLHRAANW